MVSIITITETATQIEPVERAIEVLGQAVPASADSGLPATDLTGYGGKLTADTSLALLTTQEEGSDPLDDLLEKIDTNGDGLYDAKDAAKLYLQSEMEAAIKRQERTVLDSGMAYAAVRPIDTNNDGVISPEEKKAVYG